MTVELKDFLSVTPESLAKEQGQALKTHVIETLTKIINLVKANKFEDVLQYTEFSPAGDGMGCDNTYIEFVCGDIGDAMERLVFLRNLANKGGE